MHFEDVNERASLRCINGVGPLFRFEYFLCGSCRFLAAVRGRRTASPAVNEDALFLEY